MATIESPKVGSNLLVYKDAVADGNVHYLNVKLTRTGYDFNLYSSQNGADAQEMYSSSMYFSTDNLRGEDIVRIFGARPSTAAVTISVTDVPEEEMAVKVDGHALKNWSASTQFVGSTVSISHISASNTSAVMKVSVNGEAVEPDADGVYSFKVAGDSDVKVTKTGDAVENISADSEAVPAGVYNLQGIRVASSLENLPAGVYITGGKKVLVK